MTGESLKGFYILSLNLSLKPETVTNYETVKKIQAILRLY